ncbi:hypothetical protein M1615_00050 [Patescibacteria group bacterium]|nr:hypothetical protein [Patescibacteria group bacterium]
MLSPEISSRPMVERSRTEECGVSAIFSKTGRNVSNLIPGLNSNLQHRGYDCAGMAAATGEGLRSYAQKGLVDEVFPPGFDFAGSGLLSPVGMGHNRYATSGEGRKDGEDGMQPFIAKWRGQRIAVAYNGNLPETQRAILRQRLPSELKDSVYDTQDIANAIVSADGAIWEERIKNGMSDVLGAYSLTILTDDGRLFGLRGPSGTWPLWCGETDSLIIFASETRVYDQENIAWSEVQPGELVEATRQGVVRNQIFEPMYPQARCALHDVYGAREDSLMEQNISFSDFRRALGRELAREYPLSNVDCIVGVPDTGLTIAEGFAEELGRKSISLITKNGSASRSFIAPTLEETSRIVDGKFTITQENLARERSVLLIDDSLIRGRTMGGDPERGRKGVIQLVRNAGAREVHLAVVLPKFIQGCDMGYYIRQDQLVAMLQGEDGSYKELLEDQIAQVLGCDSVYFLSDKGLERAYRQKLDRIGICTLCVGGGHPFPSFSGSRNGLRGDLTAATASQVLS